MCKVLFQKLTRVCEIFPTFSVIVVHQAQHNVLDCARDGHHQIQQIRSDHSPKSESSIIKLKAESLLVATYPSCYIVDCDLIRALLVVSFLFIIFNIAAPVSCHVPL